ncbi:hypothetical protein HYH03_011688 [Edaphochlamys debaryana]|uniref:Uncharacterized protein n=1 Tax=Edaphochlamys debaryana TaxID=47281 RepID=A0A835XTL4_9CHLO|nr:hypothetical protein HYH03_011688 [Edaphochlamys debaryana]|eukprot:KAG2489886.1 hypothetical protein HYH03_011688 [Edaphochlamys debaryana]
MSLAALEWLPQLSLLVRRAVLPGGPLGEASSVLGHVIPALVLWIAALAEEGAQPAALATAASAAAPGTAPGPGPATAPDHIHASGSGTQGGDPEASAPAASGSRFGLSDWQRFLVEEVGAVQVVGAVLAAAEKWLGGSGGGGGSSSVANGARVAGPQSGTGSGGSSGGSGGSSSTVGSETGSDSAAEAGSTVTGLESGSSGKAGGGDSAEAAEVQEGLTTLPVTAAVIHLARLLHGRRLLGAAGAGSGPSLPWRPEALRVLRRALEAECAGVQDGEESAAVQKDGAERARSQEEGEPSSNRHEDGAICGAALEQLAACLKRASSGAGGSGGAPEVEGLGVDAEVLEAAARAVNRLLRGRLWLPAVQPLAEARALRPHSAAGAGAAGSNASASASLGGGGTAAAQN